MRESLSKRADASAPMADGAIAEAMPAAPVAAAPAARIAEPGAKPMPPRQGPVPPSTAPVTAGMVDDNADFAEYLRFRDRTQVAHRARDVRERYLLMRDRASLPVYAAALVDGLCAHYAQPAVLQTSA